MPHCLALKNLTLIKGATGAKEMHGVEAQGRAGKLLGRMYLAIQTRVIIPS